MKEANHNGSPRPRGEGPGVRAAKQRGPYRDLGDGASTEAKRVAAVILEVLAGARTPPEAATVLKVSLPRYYLLEVRALHGMLVACEPRSRERGPSPASALATLQRECEQLRRECTRQQTLVRAAQRTMGLTPPAPESSKPDRNGKKRRRRRPMVRALRVLARLKQDNVEPVVETTTVSET